MTLRGLLRVRGVVATQRRYEGVDAGGAEAGVHLVRGRELGLGVELGVGMGVGLGFGLGFGLGLGFGFGFG